jgi:hypothetical protein
MDTDKKDSEQNILSCLPEKEGQCEGNRSVARKSRIRLGAKVGLLLMALGLVIESGRWLVIEPGKSANNYGSALDAGAFSLIIIGCAIIWLTVRKEKREGTNAKKD